MSTGLAMYIGARNNQTCTSYTLGKMLYLDSCFPMFVPFHIHWISTINQVLFMHYIHMHVLCCLWSSEHHGQSNLLRDNQGGCLADYTSRTEEQTLYDLPSSTACLALCYLLSRESPNRSSLAYSNGAFVCSLHFEQQSIILRCPTGSHLLLYYLQGLVPLSIPNPTCSTGQDALRKHE